MCPPLDTTDPARQLIHIPILHSPADMGSMGEKLVSAYIERFGRRHWEEYLAAIEGFWRNVRAELDRLQLNYSRVDLYQDGLPVCGREMEIVQKAGAMGGENYKLLLDLLDKGATLMGTEDPNLLLREYRSVQAGLAACDTGVSPTRVADVLAESGIPAAEPAGIPDTHDGNRPSLQTRSNRDAYIGRRIDASLQPGRIGILFLGMTHDVESYLPADIVVRRLARPG